MDTSAAVATYFAGEKQAGLFVAAVGVVGLAAAALFLQPRWGLRSLGVTLGVLALVELAIGLGLYFKTGPQVDELMRLLGSDAPRFYAEEIPRMVRVQRNFVILEVAWLVVLAAAMLTAVLAKQRFAVAGVALGLLVNVAVILAFDLVAERRGAVYLDALRAASSSPG